MKNCTVPAALGALAVALACAACSSAKPAVHATASTTLPFPRSSSPTTAPASTTSSTAAPSAFPAVVNSAFATMGSNAAPLVAPTNIPVPPTAPEQDLSATTTSTTNSWTVDLYTTPTPFAVNDPVLSSAPYGPTGPDFLGSFGATEETSASTASPSLATQAQQLDSTCRSQLTPVSLGNGIDGQQCANGTGTTFLWSEGNWKLAAVTSNSNGPADTELAYQMVTYLHTNLLPPPGSVGVIKATATGGASISGTNPSVTVPGTAATSITIEWAQGDTTLVVTDAFDAIDGLQMAVSETAY